MEDVLGPPQVTARRSWEPHVEDGKKTGRVVQPFFRYSPEKGTGVRLMIAKNVRVTGALDTESEKNDVWHKNGGMDKFGFGRRDAQPFPEILGS